GRRSTNVSAHEAYYERHLRPMANHDASPKARLHRPRTLELSSRAREPSPSRPHLALASEWERGRPLELLPAFVEKLGRVACSNEDRVVSPARARARFARAKDDELASQDLDLELLLDRRDEIADIGSIALLALKAAVGLAKPYAPRAAGRDTARRLARE